MRFKVGDKVEILDGSKIQNYKNGWVSGMKRYVGETKIITYLNSDGSCKIENTSFYDWDPRGLRLVEETIVIYRKGQDVIALDKSTGNKAIAKCNPEDKFDFQIGTKLAFDRLMEENKIKIGDKVKIIDKGCLLTRYYPFFEGNDIDVDIASRFKYRVYPKEYGETYEVVAIGKVCCRPDRGIVISNYLNECFLILENGLKKC